MGRGVRPQASGVRERLETLSLTPEAYRLKPETDRKRERMSLVALLIAAQNWSVYEAVSPATELRLAVFDLANRVPAEARPVTRYLSLYAQPAQEREAARAVVSFVLNSISRADRIIVPSVVPGTDGRLLRISLERYQLPAEVWEALAGEDPYWHLRTKIIDPKSKRVREVFTDGGWLPLAEPARLRELSHSGGALLRADFFVARSTTTTGGGFYYQWAGVPERKPEFFAAIGVSEKTIGRLHADEGANVIFSRITRKVRRIVRRQGPLGGAWETYDVKSSTVERDPFRNPFAFKYDATEHIAAKRNGLHVFALYDSRQRRQDSVPEEVAKDASDPHGDGIVKPMISCVRCHVEDGLRPFTNDQQRLLTGGVDLLTERPQDAERLAAFYDTDLGKRLRRDREDFQAAVAQATGGRTTAEIAQALADLYASYIDELVTAERAARELGISVASFESRLAAADDPVILALCQGMSVQRLQWEASFAQAALLGFRRQASGYRDEVSSRALKPENLSPKLRAQNQGE